MVQAFPVGFHQCERMRNLFRLWLYFLPLKIFYYIWVWCTSQIPFCLYFGTARSRTLRDVNFQSYLLTCLRSSSSSCSSSSFFSSSSSSPFIGLFYFILLSASLPLLPKHQDYWCVARHLDVDFFMLSISVPSIFPTKSSFPSQNSAE